MSQPSTFWWQKYGSAGQIAQATVALLGFTQRWIDSEMRRLGVSAPDCKVRKT
jgi:hypothetical protein